MHPMTGALLRFVIGQACVCARVCHICNWLLQLGPLICWKSGISVAEWPANQLLALESRRAQRSGGWNIGTFGI